MQAGQLLRGMQTLSYFQHYVDVVLQGSDTGMLVVAIDLNPRESYDEVEPESPEIKAFDGCEIELGVSMHPRIANAERVKC